MEEMPTTVVHSTAKPVFGYTYYMYIWHLLELCIPEFTWTNRKTL